MKRYIILVMIFIGLAPFANSQSCQISFSGFTHYPIFSNTNDITSSDFNNDGNLDLAISDYMSGLVNVLLGQGTGSFSGSVSYTVPHTGLGGIVAADFTGDGKIDLATSYMADGAIAILTGNGFGAFAFSHTVTVGTYGYPVGLVTADFNGDGIADLATANTNLHVLLGTGGGNFNPSTSYPVGSGPQDVTAGDFNLDGKIDLAVAHLYSKNVAVLLGDGVGSFTSTTSFSTGIYSQNIVTSDVNSDGNLDLFVSSSDSTTVSILLGSVIGTFGNPTKFNTGKSVGGIAVKDLNNDGINDLAVSSPSTNVVTTFLGLGTNNFGTANSFSVSSWPNRLIIKDFNNDGKSDIAVVTQTFLGADVLVNSNCVGIEENDMNGFIKLFPNPNNGAFTIKNSLSNRKSSVQIHNAIGQLVFESKLNLQELVIDEKLENGIYLLSFVEDGFQISCLKLVIQN